MIRCLVLLAMLAPAWAHAAELVMFERADCPVCLRWDRDCQSFGAFANVAATTASIWAGVCAPAGQIGTAANSARRERMRICITA